MNLKRMIAGWLLAVFACSLLVSNIYAMSEEDRFTITFDQGELQESYDHFPKVEIDMKSVDDVDDIRIVLVDELMESDLAGQWQQYEEDGTWHFMSEIKQEGKNMKLQLWQKEELLYESGEFTICLPKPKVDAFIAQEPLKKWQIYDRAIELQLQFNTVMDIEKTHFYQQQEKLEMTWTKDHMQASIVLSKQDVYCLNYELVSEAGVITKGSLEGEIVLDFDKPQVSVYANGESLQKGSQFDKQVTVKIEVDEKNLDIEKTKLLVNQEVLEVEWQKEAQGYWTAFSWQDGNYELAYDIVDLAGHHQEGEYASIMVDSKQPTIHLQALSKTIDQKLQLQIKLQDENLDIQNSYLVVEHLGKQQTLYPKWQQEGNNYSYLFSADQEGKYIINAYALDRVNHQQKANISLTVDKTAPTLALYYQNKAIQEPIYTNRSLWLKPYSNDEHLQDVKIELRKNDQPYQTLPFQAFDLKAIKDQNDDYEIVLSARDQAGNYAKATYAIAIHTAMEEIVIADDAFANGTPSSWIPSIKHEGDNYRVVHVSLYRNHERVEYVWKDPITQPGNYQLEVVVEDRYHNQKRLKKPFTFRIAKADALLADEIEIEVGKDHEILDSDLSDVVVRIDGVELKETENYHFQPKQEKTYHIEVEGIDQAGEKVYKQYQVKAQKEGAKEAEKRELGEVKKNEERNIGVFVLCMFIIALGIGGYVIKRKNRGLLSR